MAVNEKLNGNLTVDGSITQGGNAVQQELVSNINIKTVNGSSILGSGNLVVGGGGGIHLQRNIPSGGYGNLYVTYSSFTTTVASANRLHLMPFIPNQTLTIQNLSINVSTLFATGLAKILIYSDVSGVPTNKLYESSDLDCSTTGIKTATTSFTFNAGTTYWLGMISNNSTNVFTHYNQANVLSFTIGAFSAVTYAFLSTTFASIPSTLPSLSYTSGNIPAVTIQRT